MTKELVSKRVVFNTNHMTLQYVLDVARFAGVNIAAADWSINYGEAMFEWEEEVTL